MAGIARDLGTSILRLIAAFPDDRRDAKMTLAVYADGLRGIRPDAVDRAVRTVIETLQFFPTVADLRERCEGEVVRIALESKQPPRDDGKPFVAWTKDGVGLKRMGEDDEAMLWRMRVRGFVKRMAAAPRSKRRPYWPDAWGPAPDRAGCRSPAYILREFDLHPIVEQKESARSASDVARVRAVIAGLELDDRPGVVR